MAFASSVRTGCPPVTPTGTFAAGGVVVVVVVDGAGGLVVEVVDDAAGLVVEVVEAAAAVVDGATDVVDEVVLAPVAPATLPKGHPASSATALVPATRTAARQRPLWYNPISGLEHGTRQLLA
jgi:hypothetical protein